MAIAASIDIILAAKTAKFEQGLNRARARLETFSSSVGKSILGFALSFIAAEKVLGQLVNRFDSLESLVRSSDTLGIAADKLAGIHLQAENSSISVERIDAALAKFARNTASDLRPVDVRFRSAAQQISRMESETQKLLKATELFGRGAQDLIPLLNEGAKGFDDAQKKAREYGLAMSELDADKIKEIDDKIDELKARWKGFETQVVVKSAPAIGVALDAMNEQIKHGGLIQWHMLMQAKLAWQNWGKEVEKTVNKTGDAVVQITEEMQSKADQLRESLKSPIDRFKEEMAELRDFTTKGLFTGDEFDQLAERAFQAMKKARRELAKLHSPGDFLGIGNGIEQAFGSGGSALRSLDDWFESAKEKTKDFLDRINEFHDIGAPGAAEKGSMEAFSAQADIQRQQQMVDVQQLAAMNAVKAELTRVGGEIVKSIKGILGLTPAKI